MADTVPSIRVSNPKSNDAELASPGHDYSATVNERQVLRPLSSSSEGIPKNGSRPSPIKPLRNHSSNGGTHEGIAKASNTQADPATTTIDPLSHHILKRQNTESVLPQKFRATGSADGGNGDGSSPASPEPATSIRHSHTEPIRTDSFPGKDKKKGVSFLSRFSIISSKKKEVEDVDDDESELGDGRMEGMDAHVFSSSIGANGYIPRHKEPPSYIKVRQHNKKEKDFYRMFLAQELSGFKYKTSDENVPGITTSEIHTRMPAKNANAVWATEFSRDGKYLAVAGQDQVVRVWSVISTPEERQAHEQDEEASTNRRERLSAPVFLTKPVRVFEGHTSVVLDLSWSKNNFLLSSSMDKTVRLWHISRQECLCTFKHKDFVTSIAFHPKDDRFFLAGSLDSVLRLWSIPDKSVAFWHQLPDLITAVAFTPDGKTSIVGVLSGLCMFYETEGLKYHTQIHVRSSRGKNAKGSKITGIRTCVMPPNDSNGEVKLLISSNDSRIRMYNFRDKSLVMKFKGLENSCSQIKASFSDDCRYVICGSEDRKTYIWSTSSPEAEQKDKRPVEQFEAHSDMVTTTLIAPVKTRQLLGMSGDPIYDLCNPPPVTLLSREESNVSSKPPTLDGAEKRDSDATSEAASRRPEESPAYLSRTGHPNGNIIITADHSGSIKVFRQDCAYQKRRNETWETGSAFSKKLGAGKLARSGSVMTRNSTGSKTHRNSVSQTSIQQFPSDRILSWRNSIASNASLDGTNSIRTSQMARSDRSISPAKYARGSTTSFQSPDPNTALNQCPTPTITASFVNATGNDHEPHAGLAPTTNTKDSNPTNSPTPASINEAPSLEHTPSQPPTPSFTYQSASDDDPLRLDSAGRSYQFWNLQAWRSSFSNGGGGNSVSGGGSAASNSNSPTRPDPSRLGSNLPGQLSRSTSSVSAASKMTDEVEEEAGMDDDGESEGEALVCRYCGSKDFRARKTGGKKHGGGGSAGTISDGPGPGLGSGAAAAAGAGGGVATTGTRLVCTRCGMGVD